MFRRVPGASPADACSRRNASHKYETVHGVSFVRCARDAVAPAGAHDAYDELMGPDSGSSSATSGSACTGTSRVFASCDEPARVLEERPRSCEGGYDSYPDGHGRVGARAANPIRRT